MKIVLEGQEATDYISSLTNQAETPQKHTTSVAVLKAKVAKLETLLVTRNDIIDTLNNQLANTSPVIEEIPEAPITFHKPTTKRSSWSDEDLSVLTEVATNCEKNDVTGLANRLNRTEAAIRAKASHIGLYTKHNKLLVSE